MTDRPKTIGALRETGYRSRTVKEELRSNLITALAEKRALFQGIVGYDATVIPQVENAILSGQDIIFLGERGQAKTRMARLMINLLDEEIPIIKGSEVNDDPYDPIGAEGRKLLAEYGDNGEIEWIPR